MDAPSSPHSVLGLRPDADARAIDRAYKELIKRNHPDRGGDPSQAAQINWAYAELRGRRQQELESSHKPGDIAEAIYAKHAARKRVLRQTRDNRKWLTVLLIAVPLLLVIRNGDYREALPRIGDLLFNEAGPSVDYSPRQAAVSPNSMDSPIDAASVDQAIRTAIRIGGRNEEALADWSRGCHLRLREQPNLSLLDSCVAFDNAAVAIVPRNPIGDEGPFSASSVTARHMVGATVLTEDYIGIEGRLDRIRSRVAALMAPKEPSSVEGLEFPG